MRLSTMKSLRTMLSSTELAFTILLHLISPVSAASSLTFPPAPASNLDISQLGQVAILGDFSGASLYQYAAQSEAAATSNGSLSLLSRYPSGAFATLQASDAYIQTMCALSQNGTFVGVVVGGNFTSLGGVNSPAVALYRPDTQKVQAMPGLNGRVNALYCNTDGTLYVGGLFSAGNSSNAIAWTNSTGFRQLPFVGFNGAVTSIVKESNGDIVFAGSFDGLGNSTTPELVNSQEIPLPIATVAGAPVSNQNGFADPKNILCKTDDAADGAGDTFLLADGAVGTWSATMPFGFNPTLLRIRNTAYQGRGTKAFYFVANPSNGIMNMSYVDNMGNTQYCTNDCQLPQGNTTYQEFQFVNSIGMDGFIINMVECYGNGCGLSGIQLFESDIYTFAVNEFNEPQCPGVTFPANSLGTGNWQEVLGNPMQSPSYQKATLNGAPIAATTTTMVFNPDIRQSGNYTVFLYTPGCLNDASCDSRGRVTVTGSVATTDAATNQTSFTTEIYQTNNYDKYDQIFLGHIDATSSTFRPSITLAPSPDQTGPLTIVAQRVRFDLVTTSGGLNGLFEFNPAELTVDMNFRKSTVDSAATSLDSSAQVNSLVDVNGLIYAGGVFTGPGIKNFFSIGSNATNIAYGGLNGAVLAMYANGSTIYVGGSFTATTETGGPSGLVGIAAYDAGSNTWSALGGGVHGSVNYIVPFTIALSGSNVIALALSGTFDQINAVGSGAAASAANNFAVWIPSKNDWLANISPEISTIALQGLLTSGTTLPNGNPDMFAGAVASFDVNAAGAVELTGSGATALEEFPVNNLKLGANGAALTKRAAVLPTAGVVAGTFYDSGSTNWTVLAGTFTATDSKHNAISNLAIINGANSSTVSGIPASLSSTWNITSVAVSSNLLFIGGLLSGTLPGTSNTVTNLAVWDLGGAKFASTQPSALTGSGTPTVNAISAQPSKGSNAVFVGGSFTEAGSLPCAALCIYDSSRQQWTAPIASADSFSGTVSQLSWVDSTHLLVAGDLKVNGTAAIAALYNVPGKFFVYSAPVGPVNAASLGGVSPGSSNGSIAWVASNTGAVVGRYDSTNNTWSTLPTTLLSNTTTINGLQIFTLSQSHSNSPYLPDGNSLMLLGHIVLANGTTATAAVFNGSGITPFLLTSNNAGTGPGQAFTLIAQNAGNFFSAGKKHLAVGFIVLIGLALALGVVFLLIAAGMIARIIRRRRMGYRAAPTGEKSGLGGPAIGTGAGALVGAGAAAGTQNPEDNNIARENLRRIHPGDLFGSLTGRGWRSGG